MDLDAPANIDVNFTATDEGEFRCVPPTTRQPSRKFQNGFCGKRIPSARFFANQGFDGASETDATPASDVHIGRSYRSDTLNDVNSLEVLIKRQKDELQFLEEELISFQNQWQQRVKDLRRQHKEERKKMLRLIDHDELFRNDTQTGGNIASVSEYYYYEPGKLNNEENIEQANNSPNAAALGIYEL